MTGGVDEVLDRVAVNRALLARQRGQAKYAMLEFAVPDASPREIRFEAPVG